jgi:trimethylamine--corrinoid protein Co-methyltransferase
MSTMTPKMLTKIHDASMDILRSVGVAFNSNQALEIFKKAGLRVDGKAVFFSEKDVRKALDSAPSHFRMAARNTDKSVDIGGDDFALAPGYGASFIVSADGRQRRTVKDDYDNFCKLVQTSETITVCGFLMAEPSDLPRDTAHLDMLFSNMVLCDKPFMGCPVSGAGARDSLNMAGLLFGGKDRLKEKPVTISLITPLSPLSYTAQTSEAIIELAGCGQALIFGALLMADHAHPTGAPRQPGGHGRHVFGPGYAYRRSFHGCSPAAQNHSGNHTDGQILQSARPRRLCPYRCALPRRPSRL